MTVEILKSYGGQSYRVLMRQSHKSVDSYKRSSLAGDSLGCERLRDLYDLSAGDWERDLDRDLDGL